MPSKDVPRAKLNQRGNYQDMLLNKIRTYIRTEVMLREIPVDMNKSLNNNN